MLMPYPPPDDDVLLDMLEPRERMLFDCLQNQMRQTDIVMRALIVTRWWAVGSSMSLAFALTFYGIALMLK